MKYPSMYVTKMFVIAVPVTSGYRYVSVLHLRVQLNIFPKNLSLLRPSTWRIGEDEMQGHETCVELTVDVAQRSERCSLCPPLDIHTKLVHSGSHGP